MKPRIGISGWTYPPWRGVECERGEDAAVAAYQEALQHGDFPHDVRAVLRQQYMGIQAAHDRVRDLRDRTP